MFKYQKLYEERAAILEQEGGMTRENAEIKAALEVKWIWIEDEDLDMRDWRTYNKIRKFEQELIYETH